MEKLLFFLLVSKSVLAQSVSGIVTDSTDRRIPGATVLLFADTVLVRSTFADSSGTFCFKNLQNEIPYHLSISAVGFSTLKTETFQCPCLSPERFVLHKAPAVDLDEVVVTAKKPLIEHQIDRTIVNVDVIPGAATGNVISLLEKTPGVTVADNHISLNGKSSVMVMMDGRPTRLSGKDLAGYLRSLSAADIEKIELIENPPARYDAEGGAIINLKMKRSRKVGWSGNLDLTHNVGQYWRNYDGISLNYHVKKLTLYTNWGYFHENSFDKEIRNTQFMEETQTITSDSRFFYLSKGLNIRTGADYFLSDKTTMGVFYRVNMGKHPVTNTFINTTSGAGTTTTLNDNNESRKNEAVAFYISHKPTSGRELSMEVNQIGYISQSDQKFENYAYDSAGQFKYISDADIKVRSANLDYLHTIKDGNLETGIKTSFMNSDNQNNYFDYHGNEDIPDLSKSNHFQYRENINAAYISGQKKWNRLGIKTGLRYENTRAYGLQLGNENVERSEFKRNYSDLFHNVFVSYNLDSAANHVLTVLTTRRLNRPYYLNLNPFVQYRDPYNYTMGNPLLNPQMQNRYEILYRFKGLLNMGLSYNLFTDVILPTTETIDNVFYTKHDNIAVGYMYLLNTTVNARFASWWNFIYTVRLSHIGLRGKVYVENLDYGINVARIELHNNFTISKKLSALVYSYYASKDLNGQMVSKAMFRTNLGLQWKILNEKATISLSFDDIFHSWQSRKYSTNITNAYVTSAGVGDTRRIGLSFSYRFDKGKNTRRGKTTRGTEEENGRI